MHQIEAFLDEMLNEKYLPYVTQTTVIAVEALLNHLGVADGSIIIVRTGNDSQLTVVRQLPFMRVRHSFAPTGHRPRAVVLSKWVELSL